MVLFDILVGQDGKINGYFDGVDVNPRWYTSHDKSNDNKDTLVNIVYYATRYWKRFDLKRIFGTKELRWKGDENL